MFRNVLIAEDYDSFNIAINSTLDKLAVEKKKSVTYCDDAFSEITRAIKDASAYDLLLTDLSFDKDPRRGHELSSGHQLIAKIREENIDIKIIVFSVEKSQKLLQELIQTYKVDGFVSKGRGDAQRLETALLAICDNQQYICPQVERAMRSTTSMNVNEYDKDIMLLLARGFSQKEISVYCKENNIIPASKSAIEKRLAELRDIFGAQTNIELIAMSKDLGII